MSVYSVFENHKIVMSGEFLEWWQLAEVTVNIILVVIYIRIRRFWFSKFLTNHLLLRFLYAAKNKTVFSGDLNCLSSVL